MLLKFNVIRKASGKFEVEPPSWVTQDSRHQVKIGGQYAMDIYDLLTAAIAEHNRGIDEGGSTRHG